MVGPWCVGGGGPALEEGGPGQGCVWGLGADSGRRGWLARQPAPLAGADAVVGIAGYEFDGRRLHHAVVLPDDASLAAFVVFDHDRPLEHGPHSDLLSVHDRIEAAADLVIEGWDDAGQRHEINDLAHMLASLGLVGGFSSRRNRNCRTEFGRSEFYQTLRFPRSRVRPRPESRKAKPPSCAPACAAAVPPRARGGLPLCSPGGAPAGARG